MLLGIKSLISVIGLSPCARRLKRWVKSQEHEAEFKNSRTLPPNSGGNDSDKNTYCAAEPKRAVD
jgi:hypothetical protein